MEVSEFEQRLSTLEKKQDKILNLLTKVAKTLHLVPVTEKEEKAIQLLQRNNLSKAAKVNAELNDMENKSEDDSLVLGIDSILNESMSEVYGDVIGTDFITPEESK